MAGEQQISEKQIDEAIDRAVRDMMSLDPPAGLRARVLAHLEQPRRPQWPGARAAAYLGAAAAVALLTLVLFRQDTHPAPESQHAAAPAVLPRPAPPEITKPIVQIQADVAREPHPTSAPHRQRNAPLADRPVSAASVAPQPSFDPIDLSPVPPIEVSRIETRPIAQHEIGAAPLTAIAPLTIEPLPPPGGMN